MTTHVKKCLAEIQRMIDEEGLQGISGTHFDKGDPVRRVLKAKQVEYKLYTTNSKCKKGKHASKALIAKDLYGMLTSSYKLIIGECSSCFSFIVEDEKHICNEATKCSPEAAKIIHTALFNDSQKK